MTDTLQSPLDVQSFSTPPTTPKGELDSQKPSLSRRGTGIRPQSLSLTDSAEQWRPPLVVDETNSPELSKTVHNAPERVEKLSNRNGNASMQSNAAYVAPNDSPQSVQMDNYSAQGHLSLKSPCFVHFGLDKAASLTDWLRNSKIAPKSAGLAAPRKLDSGQSESRQLQPSLEDKISSLNGIAAKMAAPSYDEDSEDDGAGSLTRQLAETAVGVREMSKQLGRARVRSNIQNVLVITKARDNRLIKLTRELALYLMLKPRENGRGLVVYVDAQLRHSKRFDAAGIQRDHPDLFRPFMPKRRASSNTSSNLSISALREKLDLNGRPHADEGQLRYWTSDMCTSSPHLFDFVVTLGGDGTVLFTSWLFQRIVPPVLPFALGSLGFLTNFDFADHQTVMESAIESGIRVNLRMRFTCTVYRAVAPEEGKGRKAVKKGETGEILMKNLGKGGWEALEGGYSGVSHNPCKDKEIMCYTTRPAESFEILNDLVVDRGPSPYVSLLELFGDEHHMTTVQADGLTISTPTGSTAYSLSAGGSLVHPEIPALLITPICPHTLSFRPMLLPDTMELRVCVPYNSRSTAWASFDGRGRVELKQGDHIKVTASKYPFPTVCADKQSTDWFNSISRTLKWNERERQKSFVVVEEGASETTRKRTKQPSTDVSGAEGALGEADEEDEEEEEEKFDIDDSSPEANSSSASASSEPSPKTAAAAMTKGLPNLDAHVYSSKVGTDSPDRFHGRPPQPPKLSPRHAQKTQAPEQEVRAGEQGDRDNIHSPRAAHQSGRSRIPRDRDLDGENVLTPRAFEQATRRPSGEGARRAFAVWGHDESDSNTSDSESG